MISVLMLSLAGRQGCLGQYSVLTNTFSGAVWWADSSGRRQGVLCAPHVHLSIHSRTLPAARLFPQQPRAWSERIKKPDALAASRPRLSPPLCAAFLRHGTAPSLRAQVRPKTPAAVFPSLCHLLFAGGPISRVVRRTVHTVESPTGLGVLLLVSKHGFVLCVVGSVHGCSTR